MTGEVQQQPAPSVWARIENGEVVNLELWVAPPVVDGVTFVTSTTAQIGDEYDAQAGAFTARQEVLEDVRADGLADIAAQRWNATQLFTYDGVLTQADGAIAVITARLALRRETGIPDAFQMKFKLADGQFRSWNKAGEVAFGAAIGQHVQGCFDVEEALTTQIQAATSAADVRAIVEGAREAWPS